MNARTILLSGAAIAASLLVGSCGGGASAAVLAPTPKGLESLKMAVPADNPLTEDKAALGKMLFFDQRLSKDGSMACKTCHEPDKAWTDGIRFAKKAGGDLNTRNSPSMLNTGYLDQLYWDGRTKSLEQTAEAAWKNQMGGDPEAVAKTLAGIEGYKGPFQKAFTDGVTSANIVKALASFLRSLQAGNSPYDNGKMSEAAKRGEATFKVRCAACHAIPLFSDKIFHNIGAGETPDPGRGKVEESKPGAFKTPSLRNVTKTAPYFHDGSVAVLRDAVKAMAQGGIQNEHLDPILVGLRSMPPVTDKEIDDLVEFLKALESPAVAFAAPTVPK